MADQGGAGDECRPGVAARRRLLRARSVLEPLRPRRSMTSPAPSTVWRSTCIVLLLSNGAVVGIPIERSSWKAITDLTAQHGMASDCVPHQIMDHQIKEGEMKGSLEMSKRARQRAHPSSEWCESVQRYAGGEPGRMLVRLRQAPSRLIVVRAGSFPREANGVCVQWCDIDVQEQYTFLLSAPSPPAGCGEGYRSIRSSTRSTLRATACSRHSTGFGSQRSSKGSARGFQVEVPKSQVAIDRTTKRDTDTALFIS